MSKNKKCYVAVVEEVLRRRVVVQCDPWCDEEDAHEAVEDLCNDGTINLESEDFVSRSVEVLHEATHEEKARLPKYLA